MTATDATVPSLADDPPGGQDHKWRLGTRLLVTATALWTLFLLAHLALVDRWWLWLVVETMPPVTVVIVPAVLLALTPLARPVRGRLAVLLVALLLIGTPYAGIGTDSGTGTDSAQPGTTRVKVFSWNTDYWHMSNDVDAFYHYLRAQNADVYLLQEYLFWREGPVRIDDLARLRDTFPGYHIAVDSELVTLSRMPIVSQRLLPVPDTDWRGSRVLRTEIKTGDRLLSVYNVHFAVPIDLELSPFSAEFYRFLRGQHLRRQAEMSAIQDDVAGNPLPILVAGDFNSAWVSTVELRDGLTRRDPTSGAPMPTSWPASGISLPRLWRLDWLFTTDDVRVGSYRFQPSQDFSDHLAQEIHIIV
jgi:endonuclease/exonuclease/phosphatase (EEP) superfamily protein YafD